MMIDAPPQLVRFKIKPSWARHQLIATQINGKSEMIALPVFIDGEVLRETERAYQITGHASADSPIACARCGRELTHPISRLIGVGPECCEQWGLGRPDTLTPAQVEHVKSLVRQITVASQWVPKSCCEIIAGMAPARNTPAAVRPTPARSTARVLTSLAVPAPRARVEHADGRIRVFTPYEMRDACKSVPGGLWSKEERCWTYPPTPLSCAALVAAFGDACPESVHALGAQYSTALVAKHAEHAPDYPSKTPPWNHQKQAVGFLRALPAGMLAAGVGTGKTRISLDLLHLRGSKKVLVVTPKSAIKDVWERQVPIHSMTDYEVIPLGEGMTTIEKAELVTHRSKSNEPVLFVTNYAALSHGYTAARLDERTGKRQKATYGPLGAAMLGAGLDSIVVDECVPAGTLLATPDGEKAIESLSIGDTVWGYDHTANSVVPSRVVRTFQRHTYAPLYHVGPVTMTGNHPVWTEEAGYIPAASLPENSFTGRFLGEPNATTYDDLSALPQRVHAHPSASHGTKRDARQEVLQHHLLKRSTSREELAQANGISSFGSQSLPKPGVCAQNKREVGSSSEKEGIFQSFGRKRNRDASAPENATGSDGMDSGIPCSSGRATPGLSYMLQNRSSRTILEDSSGNRWGGPSNDTGKGARQEERGCPDGQGVDSAAFSEQGYSAQSRWGRHEPAGGCVVYNVETTTGNYFAHGLLVHNSHSIAGVSSLISKYAADLGRVVPHRLCMTGTPMPNTPLGIWGQYRFLQPDIFGPLRRFKEEFGILGGYGGHEVTEWVNSEEMWRRIEQICFRVRTEDVLDLPPVLDERRTFQLSSRAMRLYQTLKDEDTARIRSGEITARNALTKLLRWQQITSGYLPVHPDPSLPEPLWDEVLLELVDTGKRDLLCELLEELDKHEPAVVFCRFTRDLDVVHEVARTLGRTSAELSGRRNELATWKDGGRTILALQIEAGGAGIDLTSSGGKPVRYGYWYAVPWRPASYEQARGRMHRPGQVGTIHYYHLIADNTVDVTVYERLQQKQDVITAILDDARLGRM